MPEGPEVRRYADALDQALSGHRIKSLEARTRDARAWLSEHGDRLINRRVLRVTSHGKHLIGYIEGGFFFHSHLMMWGRWQVFSVKATAGARATKRTKRQSGEAEVLPLPVEKDRRERARILVEDRAAILFSAPIFNVGEGNPYQQIENLATLGPDIIPANGKFNKREFRRRLRLPEHLDLPIGAALLNQRILAGLGNYLRAEVLFNCRVNPWRRVGDLTERELRCLTREAHELAQRAYLSKATAGEEDRLRMSEDNSLVYQAGREMGTRHVVFRRTNLPCLRCGASIRQLRQPTFNPDRLEDEEERTRIVYFCPNCQNVPSRVL